jgi:predicted RNA-binding protein with PIN domain
MKLSVVFTVLNQLKIDHWQTKSYAEHKALGTAYKAFDGLFDKFVEIYYGRFAIDTEQKIYTIKSDSYTNDTIARYTAMRDSVLEYLGQLVSEYGDLKNIVDEIEGEFNHLLYRLQQT